MQGNVLTESSGVGSTSRTYSGQQLQTQAQAGTTSRFLYDSLGNQDCQVKSSYAGTACPSAGSPDLLEDQIYDYKSRLQGFRAYNGTGGLSKSSDYTNDPLDRPVKQVETVSGQTTTYDFTYVGVTSALSKEVLTGSGATTKRYAYDVFGNRATIAEGANRYSYLYDPHTSVSLLIDQANQVKESYGYAAYGAANAALTRTAAGFNDKTNPYRYTGKRLDSGSGTYDMGARRYSAQTGRFLQYDLYYDALDNLGLSEDPLTQNRYALAGANPINFVEVDGHWPKFIDSARKKLSSTARKALGSASRSVVFAIEKEFRALAKAVKTCGRSEVCVQAVSLGVGAVAAFAGVACGPAAGACSIVFAAVARGAVTYGLSKAGGKSDRESLTRAGLSAATGGASQAIRNAKPATRPTEIGKAVYRKVKGEKVVDTGKSGHRISGPDGRFRRGYTPPKKKPLYAKERG